MPGLALGTNAFKDETRLNTVSLPAGLTTIGDGASLLSATLEGERTWRYTDREPSGSKAG